MTGIKKATQCQRDREGNSPNPQEELTDEDFLNRWSKRKLAAQNSTLTAQEANTPHLTRSPKQEENQCESVTSSKTDADMPPLESLDKDSDYSQFLSPNVSEKLRKLALRKLFHLPQFNVTDGLNEYDEDYTAYSVLGNIVTHEMLRLRKQEEKRAANGRKLENPNDAVDEEISTEKFSVREQSAAVRAKKAEPSVTAGDSNNEPI